MAGVLLVVVARHRTQALGRRRAANLHDVKDALRTVQEVAPVTVPAAAKREKNRREELGDVGVDTERCTKELGHKQSATRRLSPCNSLVNQI